MFNGGRRIEKVKTEGSPRIGKRKRMNKKRGCVAFKTEALARRSRGVGGWRGGKEKKKIMVRGTPDDIGTLHEARVCRAARRRQSETRKCQCASLPARSKPEGGRVYRGRIAPDEGSRWVSVGSATTFSGRSVVNLLVQWQVVVGTGGRGGGPL